MHQCIQCPPFIRIRVIRLHINVQYSLNYRVTFIPVLLCLWTNDFRLPDGGRLFPSLYLEYGNEKNTLYKFLVFPKKKFLLLLKDCLGEWYVPNNHNSVSPFKLIIKKNSGTKMCDNSFKRFYGTSI